MSVPVTLATAVPAVLHDAFRRGGLPPSAAEVLHQMPEHHHTTVAALAARIVGMSRPTVRKALRALLAAGLVDRSGEYGQHWWRTMPLDDVPDFLDHLARVYETAGARERQQQRHDTERRAWAHSRATHPHHQHAPVQQNAGQQPAAETTPG